MKLTNFLLIIFISLTTGIKADSEINTLNKLKHGGYLIFIRHAYAPGRGDPANLKINNCLTQRNLDISGREQAKKIGELFLKYNIPLDKVLSSEWCRCKETASIAFKEYITKNFLNSFFDLKFRKNKKAQIKDLKDYVKNWESDKNLVLVTHYVVISEALNYSSLSGEIIITNKNLDKIGNIKIEYN